MKRIHTRVAESVLLCLGWLIALICCVCYVAGSITRDCGRSFSTIWREE